MPALDENPSCGKPVERRFVPSLNRAALALHDVFGSSALPSKTIELDRDAEIVAQGDAAEYCLEVITGCVRTCQILADGRRQIGDFLFPGDVFGCDSSPAYEYAAEAVTPVTLRRLRLSAVEDRANHDLLFARHLRQYSAARLHAARQRFVLLGRKTARERVSSFLLEMADRLNRADASAIELPMSRTDIADYLGLTTETVCRSLADLRQRRLIAVDRGHIAVLDHAGLARAALDQLH